MSLSQLQLIESKEVVNTVPSANQRDLRDSLQKRQGALETTLRDIFLTNQEESRIQKARQIMGDDIAMLSDEELQIYLTEFQYLIESWIDEYEKSVFNGKTLREVLQGEG